MPDVTIHLASGLSARVIEQTDQGGCQVLHIHVDREPDPEAVGKASSVEARVIEALARPSAAREVIARAYGIDGGRDNA